MARTQVESPRLMMRRLTGAGTPSGGLPHGRVAPEADEFATCPLPRGVPEELRAAQACARLLHDWVEDVRLCLPPCRMPRETAQHQVARAMEVGKSTLRKTIRGDRWMTFAEVIQLLAVQPRSLNCLSPGRTCGTGARDALPPPHRADASTARRWRDRYAGGSGHGAPGA